MPVLTATGAGVRIRRRWLFRDVDVQVGAGEMVAVVGPPGSGRTTLVLALADRFRLSAGRVQRDGVPALGHVAGVHEPEPTLTVAEHVRERLLLLGRGGRSTTTEPADALMGLEPTLLGWQLSPYQRQLLGLVLARLSSPRLIALDGADDGLDAAEQAELWRRLAGIAATGVAVIVTARHVDPAVPCTVVRLGEEPSPTPAEPVPVPPLPVAAPPAPDPQPEQAQRERPQPEDAQPEDVQLEDAQPEDAQPEDAQPEDAPAGPAVAGTPPQDTPDATDPTIHRTHRDDMEEADR